MRRHPLENPSLAPWSLTTPLMQKRLEHVAMTNEFWVNPERVMARTWDKRNRANALRPLPVTTIVHDLLPGTATVNRLSKGDFVFEGLPYLTRDIVVLSSIMQWFGTSVGSCFLAEDISNHPAYHPEREFLMKLAERNQRSDRPDMVTFWCHTCSSRCTPVTTHFFHDPCCYYPSEVSDRDRAVADGLLRWLGRKAGREFIALYQTRLKAARDHSDRERRRALEARRVA